MTKPQTLIEKGKTRIETSKTLIEQGEEENKQPCFVTDMIRQGKQHAIRAARRKQGGCIRPNTPYLVGESGTDCFMATTSGGAR